MELRLRYQARVDVRSGTITGVDALLHWHSAELGEVAPGQFMPVAEETKLILPIGLWMMRAVCEQFLEWQQQGLPLLRMSMTLSLQQFLDAALLQNITTILAETGMPASSLEFKISENVVMQKPEGTIKLLKAMKQIGVRLTIDHFGRSYLSLLQLKNVPIDSVTVDRAFFRDIGINSDNAAITEEIVSMGKMLNVAVIADGGEITDQQDFLCKNDMDNLQGLHVSPPLAPTEFAALLREQEADRLLSEQRG